MQAGSGSPGWPTTGVLMRVLTAPASVAARFRPDLKASIAHDAARFSGAALPIFKLLGAVAITYPIAASLVHAFGSPTQGSDSLANALRPAFDVVYAESIPFMLAAVGLGLLSPSLGVLLMAVFVPADLLGAYASQELANLSWQLPVGALLARIASYGVLWLLAVEIPLWGRGLALDWARSTGGVPSRRRTLAGFVGITIVLVYLWTTALPLLIAPIFTWSAIQTPSRLASDPTWYDWPILVAGAAFVAALSAVWPRALASTPSLRPARTISAPPTGWAVLARQSVTALVLALLLGGLITNLAEGIVLIGGVLVAGPVLTLLLPRLPAPGILGRARGGTRVLLSVGLVLLAALIVMIVADKAMFATDYLPFTALLVGSMIAFRVLVGAGIRPQTAMPGRAP